MHVAHKMHAAQHMTVNALYSVCITVLHNNGCLLPFSVSLYLLQQAHIYNDLISAILNYADFLLHSLFRLLKPT